MDSVDVAIMSADARSVAPGIATASAGELAAAIREKRVSSRELLDMYLDRIDRLDGAVNAVVTLDAERARRTAYAADELLAGGEVIGPLHGLPVTIKDALETEGVRSTGGAVELKEHVPVADASPVARLKAAGAIVFGKTNVPRWSVGMQTFNELFGTTNNPWSVDRVPGGSSGGAVAATAGGFTSFEIGTDVGGSIRVPAHFCGVFGLKPSYGVVPQRGCLYHVGSGTTDFDLNVVGPICRSAGDLDLLLGVLAAPAPEQQVAWRIELPPPLGESLADYRIGVWFDDPACAVATEYRDVLHSAVDSLDDAGGRIDEAHPAVDFTEQVGLFDQLVGPVLSMSLDEAEAQEIAGGHLAWLRAMAHRKRAQQSWADWFASYDLLLCPVSPTPAFPHLQEDDLFTRTVSIDGVERPYVDHFAWAGLINALELPSAVVPIGRTASGLPVGVQVVAPFLRDRDATRAAELISDVTGVYEVPPGF